MSKDINPRSRWELISDGDKANIDSKYNEKGA